MVVYVYPAAEPNSTIAKGCGARDGDVRMERAEDHYVQVESATLGSLCCTPARYNFRVSQWLGRGLKVKKTARTTIVDRRETGKPRWRDRFM